MLVLSYGVTSVKFFCIFAFSLIHPAATRKKLLYTLAFILILAARHKKYTFPYCIYHTYKYIIFIYTSRHLELDSQRGEVTRVIPLLDFNF